MRPNYVQGLEGSQQHQMVHLDPYGPEQLRCFYICVTKCTKESVD